MTHVRSFVSRAAAQKLFALVAVVALPSANAFLQKPPPPCTPPAYPVSSVLCAEDQAPHLPKMTPKSIFKPHETDATFRGYWVASNERGTSAEDVTVSSEAGITVFATGTKAVLSRVEIEDACIPAINPDGTVRGSAPPGAEVTRAARIAPYPPGRTSSSIK